MDVSTSASSSGSVDVQVLPASTESDRFAFPEAETETGFPSFPVVVVHRRRRDDASVRRRDAVDAVDVAVATDAADADNGVVSSRRVAPHRSVDPGNTLGARPEEDEDDVMEDLEDCDEAAAHRQAEDTADVGHEPDHRNFLENKTMVVNGLMQGPSLKAPEKVSRGFKPQTWKKIPPRNCSINVY